MFALQLVAAILLFLSAGLFFGPQLVIYGPKSFPALLKQPQARFIGGFLLTASVFAVSAPHFGSVLMTGGERITLVALEVARMSFGAV